MGAGASTNLSNYDYQKQARITYWRGFLKEYKKDQIEHAESLADIESMDTEATLVTGLGFFGNRDIMNTEGDFIRLDPHLISLRQVVNINESINREMRLGQEAGIYLENVKTSGGIYDFRRASLKIEVKNNIEQILAEGPSTPKEHAARVSESAAPQP